MAAEAEILLIQPSIRGIKLNRDEVGSGSEPVFFHTPGPGLGKLSGSASFFKIK